MSNNVKKPTALSEESPTTVISKTEGDVKESDDGRTTPKVHFHLWQVMGMNFSITSTPIAVGTYLALIIGLGGFPYYVWCFIFAGCFQMILGLVIAEMASALPHSSGPAYWVKVLSPPKYSRFLEYLVGWLTVSVWWFVTTGNMLYAAQFVVGLAEALNPSFTAAPWQVYLISVGWALLIAALHLPGAFKLVPHLLTAAVGLINFTWLFIFISMLVRARPKASARAVFVDVVNESGWSSNAVVFFLALLPGILSIGGFDSVTHITDEVHSPAKEIPQVILGSTGLSAVTGLAMVIMYSFCTTNPAGLLEPYGRQPLINALKDGLDSDALFVTALVAIILTLFLSSLAGFTSWNRLYWSFSRANGLPFSGFTAKLTSKDRLPVNAVAVNFFMVAALSAIGIGSLTALNAIFGSAAICSLASYVLVLVTALHRGRAFLDASRWLNLGRWGKPMQITALIWSVFASVWLCFPLYLPVVPETMNWTSVILVGLVLIATVYYLGFRRQIVAHDFYT